MSNRAATWLIAALVLIGFATGLWHRFLRGEGRSPEGGITKSATQARPATTGASASAVAQTAVIARTGDPEAPSNTAQADQLAPATPVTVQPSRQLLLSANALAEDAGKRAPVSQSSDDGVLIDVIGRPFPVSTSVEAACQRISREGHDACDRTHEALQRLAREPRDPAWAAEMEASLQEYVAKTEPGKYSIRALECRSSVCAIEVESIFGPYFGSFDHGAPLYSKLHPGLSATGHEINLDGARITVTVMPYTKEHY